MDSITTRLHTTWTGWQRRRALSGAIRRLRHLSPTAGSVPDSTLAGFIYGWGNEGWSASIELAQAVFRYSKDVRGDVLECGSGMTTLLLAVLGDSFGFRTWSLEHDEPWHAHVIESLARHNLASARVLHSPLRSHGAFDWYGFDASVLPDTFGLVLCDGPPGQTRGGRTGLLSAMGSRISRGTVILVDDTNREAEARMIERWVADAGIRLSVVERAQTFVALQAM